YAITSRCKHCTADRASVAPHDAKRSSVATPEPGRLVIGRCENAIAVRSKGTTRHNVAVATKNGEQVAGGLPNPRTLACGEGQNAAAIWREFGTQNRTCVAKDLPLALALQSDLRGPPGFMHEWSRPLPFIA